MNSNWTSAPYRPQTTSPVSTIRSSKQTTVRKMFPSWSLKKSPDRQESMHSLMNMWTTIPTNLPENASSVTEPVNASVIIVTAHSADRALCVNPCEGEDRMIALKFQRTSTYSQEWIRLSIAIRLQFYYSHGWRHQLGIGELGSHCRTCDKLSIWEVGGNFSDLRKEIWERIHHSP